MKKDDAISWLIVINAIMICLFIWILITNYIYSGNETLIGAGISLIGAILGGIISGLLTLIGVRITIKDNNDKRNADLIPQKLLDIEDIIFILERQYELLIKKYSEDKPSGLLNPIYRERIKYIIQYLEDDGLLRKSANVNLRTYKITRKLYNALKILIYDDKARSIPVDFPYKQINEAVFTTINDLKKECEKINNKIDM
ncbi:hypothetical protein ACWV26_06585 [Rummeliibacillus sp. JY-2-4R]